MLTTKIKVFGKTIPVWIAALALVAATAGAATGIILAGNVKGDIVTSVDQSLLVLSTSATGIGDETAATGTFTFAASVPADGSTVTIGSKTYTFKVTLTPGAENQVQRHPTSSTINRDNLVAAINDSGVSGTDYSSGTTLNLDASAVTSGPLALVATARLVGVAGNSIVTTTAAGPSGGTGGSWAAPTLTGGAPAAKSAQFNTISDDGTKFTAATEIMTGDGARFYIAASNRSTDTMAVLIKLDLMPGITADIDGGDGAATGAASGTPTGDSCVRVSFREWKCRLASDRVVTSGSTLGNGTSTTTPTANTGADFKIKIALNDEALPGFYHTTVTMTQIENKS